MAKHMTFVLGEEGERAIEEIRVATHTATKVEVIRDALALYEQLVERAKQGESVYVGTDRVVSIEVFLPGLHRARKLGQQ